MDVTIKRRVGKIAMTEDVAAKLGLIKIPRCYKCGTKFHRVRSLCRHLRRCGKHRAWSKSRWSKFRARRA